MECGPQPDDMSTRLERATGRKWKFDLNDASRRNAFRRGCAQAAEADIRAASEWCDGFSIDGRELESRTEPDAFSAPAWHSMLSSRYVHSDVPPRLLTVSALDGSSLECKSNVTSLRISSARLGNSSALRAPIGSSRSEIGSMKGPLGWITESPRRGSR
jgi:hypothetical protein